MAEDQKKPASGRILLVDKDIDIRKMMEMVLGDHYQVDTAGSAEDGLDQVQSDVPFDIIIASFTLPGMSGVEFLRRVGEKHPETIRILLTGGNPDMSGLNRAISEGHISRIVLKPFRVSTLLEELRLDMSVKNNPPARMSVPITEVP